MGVRARIRRPSPAMLVAFTALCVSLSSSSFAQPVRDAASRLITGKQVKNNSLTGRDVKDRSIRARDLAAGLAGVPGPPGAQGPQGAQGERGETGPATGPAGGDLTGTYPNPLIAPNAVASGDVADRSLTTADVAVADGLATINPGSLNDNECDSAGYGSPALDTNDVIVISPKSNVPDNYTAEVRHEGPSIDPSQFYVVVCNHTGATHNASFMEFNYAIFERP